MPYPLAPLRQNGLPTSSRVSCAYNLLELRDKNFLNAVTTAMLLPGFTPHAGGF